MEWFLIDFGPELLEVIMASKKKHTIFASSKGGPARQMEQMALTKLKSDWQEIFTDLGCQAPLFVLAMKSQHSVAHIESVTMSNRPGTLKRAFSGWLKCKAWAGPVNMPVDKLTPEDLAD